MNQRDLDLLAVVSMRCTEEPALLQNIIQAAMQGVQNNISESNQRAADMETLACVAVQMAGEKRVTKKAKQFFEQLAEQKLERWAARGTMNWSWLKEPDKGTNT